MKKVLYISNIEVPYRVRFFNLLAEHCDLTVLYEREQSSNRDKKWTSAESVNYKSEFLNGINLKNESTFSFKILKYIFSDYDEIVIGCYNSPVQMLAILLMKLFKKRYVINVDGEVFLGSGVKSALKRFFLKGAEKYLCAGVRAGESLKAVAEKDAIFPYYFSSLSDGEIASNSQKQAERNGIILVVGQYFDYKGMDIAVKCAAADESIQYKFVGMGNRTELFAAETRADKLKNVQLISFLQKEDLEKEYLSCAALLLPSRRECWGLVVNEAASYGTPIVSTFGSGAAVEFLEEKYSEYLAEPDDFEALLACVKLLLSKGDNDEYSEYLKEKSALYSIEKSVKVHLKAFDIGEE